MKYDPQKHSRRSIRLKGYDYSRPGRYFITLCTHERECIFCEILDGKSFLNQFGQIVHEEWLRTKEIRMEIELDEYIIMPNHFHAVVAIVNQRADSRPPLHQAPFRKKRGSIGTLIAGFKSAVTKRINTIRDMPGMPVWQRNYYEHIIRDRNELEQIRYYIKSNPSRWGNDEDNPINYVKNDVDK